MAHAQEDKYYLLDSAGNPVGPASATRIIQLVASGQASRRTPVNLVGASTWAPIEEWPSLNAHLPRTSQAQSTNSAQSMGATSKRAVILLGAAAAAALLLLVLIMIGARYSQVSENAPTNAPPATLGSAAPFPAPAEPTPPPTAADQVLASTTWRMAFRAAKPLMRDTVNDIDQGTALFALWSMKKLRFADVSVVNDETTPQLVLKDSVEELGKRLCYSGSLVQIEVERIQSEKMTNGLLLTPGGSLIRFFAAGSSGSLVQGDQARICGAVTGKHDYANSAGGTGHAIKVVGMFAAQP